MNHPAFAPGAALPVLPRGPPQTSRRSPVSACARPPSTPLTYASSGVDIDAEGASVAALIGALGSGARPRAPGTLGAHVAHSGGFSGLIEFGDRTLALATDGVGSKLMLAAEVGEYGSVALDVMAMNVNDLLCIGAEPLAFVDYIATPRPEPGVWAEIGRGLGRACGVARVSLCGGETATLPDMVKEIDISGTALGWLPKGEQIDGGGVGEGDVIIGLPASGVHSNGFTLARKVLEKSGVALADEAPFECGAGGVRAGGEVERFVEGGEGVTMGEVLLNPTTIYVDPLVEFFQVARKGDAGFGYDGIHGLAHVTGGGLSNLLRLKKGMGYVIEDPLEVLPEFAWMQEAGEISNFEMYRTFNMGMGMAIVVSADMAENAESWLKERLPGSKIVGRVNGSGKVTHAQFPDVVFQKY